MMRRSLPGGGTIEAEDTGRGFVVREFYPGGSMKSFRIESALPPELWDADDMHKRSHVPARKWPFLDDVGHTGI